MRSTQFNESLEDTARRYLGRNVMDAAKDADPVEKTEEAEDAKVSVSGAAAVLGAKGGSSTSIEKAKAARENGRGRS